jgi:spore maturation protein CgeB
MWLPSPLVRFMWGTPVLGDLMYSRLNRIRKREIQTEPVEAFQSKIRTDLPKKWSIRIPVPPGQAGEHWGDLYFARDLALSISKLGQDVEIHKRNLLWTNDGNEDVSLVIRGLERINPKPGKINVLWIISTPELITRDELESFDLVFAASNSWAEKTTTKTGIEVSPLLQCTDPARFSPGVSKLDENLDVVFVGNARKKIRKVIADSLSANVFVSIFGKGWHGMVPKSWISSEFIENSQLPALYGSSGIVLNDHRPDMAREGFYSNRLFDAVASGGRVVSDEVDGVEGLFEGAVKVYKQPSELAALCTLENRGQWGTNEEIVERANRIGQTHSFDERAKELVQAVQSLI